VFSCDVIEFVSAVLNEGRVNFEWTDASLGIIVGVRFFLSLSLSLSLSFYVKENNQFLMFIEINK
jgi:hypothetical protein